MKTLRHAPALLAITAVLAATTLLPACQKRDEPAPPAAGNTAAQPGTSDTTQTAPQAPDSRVGGSPGPVGVQTPGSSGSPVTGGVTGSGTTNAPAAPGSPGGMDTGPSSAGMPSNQTTTSTVAGTFTTPAPSSPPGTTATR